MKTMKVYVLRTDIILPKYLYYVFHNLYAMGFFKLTRRITAEDLGKIRMGGTWISQIQGQDDEPVLLSHLCAIGDDLAEYHIALRNDGTNQGEPVEYWEKATPGQTRAELNGTMIRICSWCKKKLGTKPDYYPDQPDRVTETHTICEDCLKKYFKSPRDESPIPKVPPLEGVL